jgi:hypothetical protein
MKYMGSKNRIAKHILPIMLKAANEKGITTWVEPFVGGANMIDKVPNNFQRIGIDYNAHTIEALIAIRDYADKLPTEVSEEYYKSLKGTAPNPITSLIRFGASFGGKFEDGFARGKTNKGESRNYWQETVRNAQKQSPNLQGVKFINGSYGEYSEFENCLIYCFDEDTELLTDKGFKLVRDITYEDKCLSREHDTGVIEYVTIDKLYNRLYKGNFYNYEGKNVSINVTQDHNLFVNKKQTRKKIKKDLLIKAKESLSQDFNFISAGGIWRGNNKISYNVLGVDYNAKDFAYLLGIFCTDGSINNQDIITISQSKPEIINKIRNSLSVLKMDYTENEFNKSRGATTFYLSRKYVPFFKQFYLKEYRKIPNDLLQYDVCVLESLLEGIIDGDGSEGRRINIGSKSMVDCIQEICYKIGKSSCYITRGKDKKSWYEKDKRWITTKKDYYVVSINNKPYLNCIKNNISIKYDEKEVYCLTLSKWNTVLSRRNGKCIWIGQCDPPYKGTTSYKTGTFDHDKFWEWCRDMSKNNVVFISEYEAPDDFICVWQGEVKTNFASQRNEATHNAVEKLFTL